MPSFILIHPTVWPQYTNVTDQRTEQTGRDRQIDRQTDRQRSDSIGRTVLQMVAQKPSEAEPWVLLNVNSKSPVAYHLPWS